MNDRRETIQKLLFSFLVGLLFLLPHLSRIVTIGSARDYTPFSGNSPSPTVWDETFMYASEVNFMLQQKQLANDTDAYEHRDEPFPYSILTAEVELGLAELTHSLGTAQIAAHFLFPAITTWLLITLLYRLGAAVPLAALLSLVILVGGFSPRTILIGDVTWLRHGFHSDFIETLQAARNPNPNMSFPLILGAALCAIFAISRKSLRYSIAAGVLGGLLFYTYTFYAIAWSAACLFLLLLSFWRKSGIPRSIAVVLLLDILLAFPFMLWMRASRHSGAYTQRAQRLGLVVSHLPSKHGVELSLIWLVPVLCVSGWWLWNRNKKPAINQESEKSLLTMAAVLVLAGIAIGGIAGMNMQIVTGFNIQAEHHYPHMVIQPFVLTLLTVVFVAWLGGRVKSDCFGARWGAVLFGLLLLACCVSQISAGYNSAKYHRIRASDRLLFDWLQRNTSIGDVVATTDLRLCTILPVYTHNYTLLANGSRTSGTDEEVIERFMIANALTATPVSRVADELRQGGGDHGSSTTTYAYFLFEHSPYSNEQQKNIAEKYMPGLLAAYRQTQVELPERLRKYRVDYIYIAGNQTPPEVPGWQTTEVLETTAGNLWRIQPQ
ncbi:MAG TPA: hypothetical protein VE178_14635 [Silvibacterium sp.]|nr:hypothetical protein [Silvibacterium sp.]